MSACARLVVCLCRQRENACRSRTDGGFVQNSEFGSLLPRACSCGRLWLIQESQT